MFKHLLFIGAISLVSVTLYGSQASVASDFQKAFNNYSQALAKASKKQHVSQQMTLIRPATRTLVSEFDKLSPANQISANSFLNLAYPPQKKSNLINALKSAIKVWDLEERMLKWS